MVWKIGTHHGVSFWVNLEPCGLFCGSMTWFLIMYGMYTTSVCVIVPWLGYSLHGLVHLVAFNSFSLLAMFSHMKAMTTDPGAVPKDAKPLADDHQEIDFEANDR
eukprot:gene9476-12767_t